MKQTVTIKIFLTLICIACLPKQNVKCQDVFVGGKIGYSMPTNIGRSSDELGFKDVAKNGWQVAFVGKWFYSKRLTLGCDFGYQHQGAGEIWDVDRYGEVDVSYQTIRLLLEGAYYFSHDEVRPYLGLAFGAYYMINSMDFNAKSSTNTSVAYRAKEWKPGISPQIGIMFELSDKTMLDCQFHMDLIAHMEPTIIHDPDYGMVTQNPHGNQNQLGISIALLFGR